ncbi:MAG: ArsR/SmtB-type metalloregulator TsoR [Thermodesulfobacteriota bacterium]
MSIYILIDGDDLFKRGASLARRDLTNMAFLARILTDENRLRILLCLRHGKKAVSSIAEELDLAQPLVSHHLKELRISHLVTVERQGVFIYYEMTDFRIVDIMRSLEWLATDLLAESKTLKPVEMKKWRTKSSK